jgi:hypothetical protein
MVIVQFLATLLWIGMILGFLFAVFWVIVAVVFVGGYNRWVHGSHFNGFATLSTFKRPPSEKARIGT